MMRVMDDNEESKGHNQLPLYFHIPGHHLTKIQLSSSKPHHTVHHEPHIIIPSPHAEGPRIQQSSVGPCPPGPRLLRPIDFYFGIQTDVCHARQVERSRLRSRMFS